MEVLADKSTATKEAWPEVMVVRQKMTYKELTRCDKK